MPIEHIKIENYKSLECLSLDMRPFMTFVGPNNSGKSKGGKGSTEGGPGKGRVREHSVRRGLGQED